MNIGPKRRVLAALRERHPAPPLEGLLAGASDSAWVYLPKGPHEPEVITGCHSLSDLSAVTLQRREIGEETSDRGRYPVGKGPPWNGVGGFVRDGAAPAV